MKRQILIVGILACLSGLFGCKSKTTDKILLTQTNLQEMTVTVDTLKQILEAFNRHDLDAIMEFFSDDCSFDSPRGPDPWGKRSIGKEQVREALAGRFKGIPDVHYGEDRHWVSANMGVSEWYNNFRGKFEGAWLRPLGISEWQSHPEGFLLENS
jgi:hypothetical protein